MGFQDEFSRRLAARQAEERGAGSAPDAEGASTQSGPREPHTRHSELVSESRPGERDRREILKLVQDDEGKLVWSDEVGGDASPSRLREDDNVEPPSRATRHDGWHPETRVRFLEALARTGNVGASAHFVQRSRQSAYDLKRRDPDFARTWLAALVIAREEAQDKLQERAIEGVEEQIFYHGEVIATRRRYDSRLLLAHLARLDKIAEQIPAQRGAARFADMLDAIGAGEDTAELIATPTEDEINALVAEAETAAMRKQILSPPEKGLQQAEPEEADRKEFYAVNWPNQDRLPEYYRMDAEEAAEMERDVPGLTATPTGTREDAEVTVIFAAARARAEEAAQLGEPE